MIQSENPNRSGVIENRVLILAPTGKDAFLIAEILKQANENYTICSDINSLCTELKKGAGAALLVEEAIADHRIDSLYQFIIDQPPWSDFPLLIMTQQGADSSVVARATEVLGNVTLLERPTRVAALLSAVHAALRARQRQYQIRSYLIERQRINEELEESHRRKDEFLAMLAHELRNPLAPIRNSIELLNLVNEPKIIQARGLISRQLHQLTRLVEDLLDVSRINEGKIELRKEQTELAAIVQSAVETSKPFIESRDHSFSLIMPSEPIYLYADAVRLAQALSNLLNNAAKYTPPKGTISLIVTKEPDHVTIQVRDNGLGISPEMLSKIFEKFVQGDHSLEGAKSGLGIGLMLVRWFAEKHGGTVTAHSEGHNKGSEFVMRLPILTEKISEKASIEKKEDIHLSGHRVLVVDDNIDNAQSLSVLLGTMGNEVCTAYDGLQALEMVPRFHPDIVLLDIGLPKLDGYGVARGIRQRHGNENILLIALTGWGQSEARRRSQEAGFDYHLVKPIDSEDMKEIQKLYTRGVAEAGNTGRGIDIS